MARIDRMYNSAARETHPDKILLLAENFKEVRDVLKEAISQYSNFSKLHDWREEWYTNAKEAYETKLEKVEEVIAVLEARIASIPTTAADSKV